MRSRSPNDWTTYKQFRNQCTGLYRKAKDDYFARMISKLKGFDDRSHHWWSLAKDIARLSRCKDQIPDLEDNGTSVTTDEDRAELLAKYFARQCCGPHDNFDNDVYGASYPLPESHPVFEFHPVTEKLIFRKLTSLPVFKITADPFLTNRILRECAPSICSSLTFLFNLSLSTNTFPDEWKKAVVTPLYKQRGSKNDPSNYRPVSLLHAVGKLLDSIVSDRLLHFLTKNNLLSVHQHGFLPRRSTVTQLIYVVEKWMRAMDSKECNIAVFMDFMKAFDRVWHVGLVHKLLRFGVSGDAVAWFASYLSDRSISVRVGTNLSCPHKITAGVPQGSHLGPILFLIFINDLPESVGISTELFADDALLHQSCLPNSLTGNYICQIQSAITDAESWATSWHGKFGHAKTKVMCISSKSLPIPQCIGPFFIDGTTVSVVDSHRHLGVTLVNTLDWSDHIRSVTLTCSKKAGLLRWMLHSIPSDVVIKLFLKFVRPSFEYAAPVWHGSISECDAIKLESIQCSVARTILKAAWVTPKSTLLKEIGWPSLRWRREILSMVLFFKLISSRPQLFCEYLPVFVKDKVNREHRKPLQLLLPSVKSSRHLNSFFIRSSILWNKLPHRIQSAPSSTVFRSLLEHHWETFKFNAYTNIPM